MPSRVANSAALILILASFACLAPGLTQPALTLDISPILPFVGKMAIFHQTRSVLGTVRNLYDTGNALVAGLILLFSVVVPCAKGLALIYALAFRRAPGRHAVHRFVGLIGKWSMADVFVMGIFLAYLAAGSANGVSAVLEPGFWWFLSACLLSVASAQLMRLKAATGAGSDDATAAPMPKSAVL